jgi:hypothetical protein
MALPWGWRGENQGSVRLTIVGSWAGCTCRFILEPAARHCAVRSVLALCSAWLGCMGPRFDRALAARAVSCLSWHVPQPAPWLAHMRCRPAFRPFLGGSATSSSSSALVKKQHPNSCAASPAVPNKAGGPNPPASSKAVTALISPAGPQPGKPSSTATSSVGGGLLLQLAPPPTSSLSALAAPALLHTSSPTSAGGPLTALPPASPAGLSPQGSTPQALTAMILLAPVDAGGVVTGVRAPPKSPCISGGGGQLLPLDRALASDGGGSQSTQAASPGR